MAIAAFAWITATRLKQFADCCVRAVIGPSRRLATTLQESSELSNTSSLTTEELPASIALASREVQQMYLRMLSEGQTPRFAEMCALQQPPGVKGTDRAFMQGRSNQQWLDDMPADHAARILREARESGISVSGRYYMSGLADKRGHRDPAAWVDSVGDIQRVARERNLTVQGIVDHKGVAMPPPKKKRLSERLTKQMMQAEREKNPALKMKDKDLREMVKDKYGYKRPKA